MRFSSRSVLLAQAVFGVAVSAQSCSTLTNDLPAPSMAPGFQSQLAATDLKFPRGIQFDTTGHLLVVDRAVGIFRFSIDDCLLLQDKTLIVNDTELNHGISMSPDGRTLFASTPDVAYSYAYNPETGEATNRKELVTGMGHPGHVTRTLLSPVSQPDWLIISVGSDGNLDYDTLQVSSGKSQIRAFNISELQENPVKFSEGGLLLGWGLRNSVGMAEDGSGQLWSVENSADQIQRNGDDVHTDNPAEELNFHGSLTELYERGNYGYPTCFSVWNVTDLPDNGGLMTGDQFALAENMTINDETCGDDTQPARLSFAAHQAPLDVKFDGEGQGWISFHGSWNRDEPIGYKLVTVAFDNYQPTEPNSSTSAARDVMANADLSKCQKGCFRPVGIAFDTEGRIFMSSDSTGEIYVIRKDDGAGVASITSTAAVMPTGMSSAVPSTFVITSNGNVQTVTSAGSPSAAATTTRAPSAANAVQASLWCLAAAVAAVQAVAFFL